jgi:dipeptidyl aminopeptidase/acylaminoacyl peptidase
MSSRLPDDRGDRGDDKRDANPITVERIAAVEPPRDVRVHPRDRTIAYVAEAAGARQLFVLSLRAGPARQLTAGAKPVSDPQWSPDGRRLAFVRDDGVWVIEADGSRETAAARHPAGVSLPRWAPDGRRLAFVSRRRGWGQVWIVDAPVPRRGRPAARPRPPEPHPVTPPGIDVSDIAWAPDGTRIAYVAQRLADLNTCQITVVDVATGEDEIVAGSTSWTAGPSWLADGALLYISDASGWFQVVRRDADGRELVLTAGEHEHGEPDGAPGYRPIPSRDGRTFVHAEFADALVRLVVADLGQVGTRAGRGRRAATTPQPGTRVDPWDGVWRAVGWLADGSGIIAMADSETRPLDAWLLPVPGGASDARPRQLTDSLPAVLAAAFGPPRELSGERVSIRARDGLELPATLWRPRTATGRRGAARVPAIVYPHGGPTAQALRSWAPFKQLLVREGFAFLDVDFRGSTGYGRSFRQANHGEWGHADVQDIVDAARWAAQQPWCDGRLAVYGGSYGGYLTLSALVEEPALWRAGVDLYGDSEIAESYRHGDRIGRIDLQRQMGSPDDPTASDLYRRGSPVYRAERIEAPVLILHGRKDKRVVPLMTERMVEALEIEGKHHEVHWYDDEGHGWERRENRRDAWERILAFLRKHVLDEPA